MLYPGIRKLGIGLAAFAAIWLFSRYLLPIAMPFLLAALLAIAADPLVRFFTKSVHIPRWAAAGIGISIALLLVVLCILTLSAIVLRELGFLAGILPDLEGTTLRGMHSLQDWLLGIADRTPTGIRSILTHSLQSFFSDSTELLDRLTSRLLSLASGILAQVPDSVLGVGTWIIATFMISAKLPTIRVWIHNHLPDSWQTKYLPSLKRLKKSLFGWLTAQCKLTAVTFCVLTVGFFALQIPYGPLWALVVSLVDAMPILGSGTILIPWSAVSFLQGSTARGIGLLGIYAAAALIRSVLEPKLIGKQLGLDPLVTLAVLYTGYQIWGILGMILAPLLAVTIVQLAAIPKNIQKDVP